MRGTTDCICSMNQSQCSRVQWAKTKLLPYWLTPQQWYSGIPVSGYLDIKASKDMLWWPDDSISGCLDIRTFLRPDIEACSTNDLISGNSISGLLRYPDCFDIRTLISGLLVVQIPSLTRYPKTGYQGTTLTVFFQPTIIHSLQKGWSPKRSI